MRSTVTKCQVQQILEIFEGIPFDGSDSTSATLWQRMAKLAGDRPGRISVSWPRNSIFQQQETLKGFTYKKQQNKRN